MPLRKKTILKNSAKLLLDIFATEGKTWQLVSHGRDVGSVFVRVVKQWVTVDSLARTREILDEAKIKIEGVNLRGNSKTEQLLETSSS